MKNKKLYTKFAWLSIFIFTTCISNLLLLTSADAQKHVLKKEFADIPTIKAYEAYVRFKRGEAIILHAAGGYEHRRIIGAINLPTHRDIRKEKNIKMPRFPKKGVYLLTYCY